MKKTMTIDFHATEGVPVKADVEIENMVEMPELPSADGDYKLVITDGVATWVLIT
ncbi:MAG: hypothetical protein ACNA7U_01250 [Candidatus Izemoplasmataceae bacterium]